MPMVIKPLIFFILVDVGLWLAHATILPSNKSPTEPPLKQSFFIRPLLWEDPPHQAHHSREPFFPLSRSSPSLGSTPLVQ
ncbi:hypothetical protein LguiA_021277 [Lonicera macranthoides]